jgi:hypothetical protein
MSPAQKRTVRQVSRNELMLTCCPDIQGEDDLLGPSAAPGAIPTDLEQATGLERLEILGKMEGIDIFDMKPLDASRKGKESRFPRLAGKIAFGPH